MTDNKKKPKWKRFEELVTLIQKSLAPNATVISNDKIKGKSGTDRQIDISLRLRVGQFDLLIVIDCKDYKVPADIKDVESFAGMLEDVSANKGALVCNSGFTEAAKRRASEKGIDLFLAVDTERVDWKIYLTLPGVCFFTGIKSVSFSVRYRSIADLKMPSDFNSLIFYNQDGTVKDLPRNLFYGMWSARKLPTEPGEYNIIVDDAVYTKVDGILYGPAEFEATFIVHTRIFFGQVPITECQGFLNATNSKLYTQELAVTFDAPTIEATWKQINNLNDLAIKPTLTLTALDDYPQLEIPKGGT